MESCVCQSFLFLSLCVCVACFAQCSFTLASTPSASRIIFSVLLLFCMFFSHLIQCNKLINCKSLQFLTAKHRTTHTSDGVCSIRAVLSASDSKMAFERNGKSMLNVEYMCRSLLARPKHTLKLMFICCSLFAYEFYSFMFTIHIFHLPKWFKVNEVLWCKH